MLLLWAWAAAAAPEDKTLVLHRSDDRPVSVLARMVGLLDADIDDFDARPVKEWVWTLEAQYDGGEVAKCETDLIEASVFDGWLQEATEAIAFFKPEVALERLETFDGALRCAGELLPRSTLGRAFFLEGVVQAKLGNEALASAAYRDARSMDRELTWDAQIAPDSRPLFDASDPGTDSAWLTVAPRPERVWVDGDLVSYGERGVRIGLGRHVVSADIEGVASADIVVHGDGALLLPGLLNDGVVAQLANPERQQIIRRFVKMSGLETVYFTNIDQVWRVRDGGVDPLIDGQRSLPEKAVRRRGRLRPVGLAIGGAGLVLAGVGAAVIGTSDKPGPGVALLGTGGALLVGGGTVLAVDEWVGAAPTLGIRGRF